MLADWMKKSIENGFLGLRYLGQRWRSSGLVLVPAQVGATGWHDWSRRRGETATT